MVVWARPHLLWPSQEEATKFSNHLTLRLSSLLHRTKLSQPSAQLILLGIHAADLVFPLSQPQKDVLALLGQQDHWIQWGFPRWADKEEPCSLSEQWGSVLPGICQAPRYRAAPDIVLASEGAADGKARQTSCRMLEMLSIDLQLSGLVPLLSSAVKWGCGINEFINGKHFQTVTGTQQALNKCCLVAKSCPTLLWPHGL